MDYRIVQKAGQFVLVELGVEKELLSALEIGRLQAEKERRRRERPEPAEETEEELEAA